MMRTDMRIALGLLALMLLAQPARSENWMQWRGPNLNGSTSETGLPDQLDPQKPAWKFDMPGGGSSTPVVFEDKLFISALDATSKKLVAMCLDSKTGKPIWRKDVGDGFITTSRINLAGPSPITDGRTVWFYFGSGDLAAFDMDGKQLWARNIQTDYGAFNFQWLYCATPLLHEGKLYVPVLHRDVPTGTTDRSKGLPTGPSESYLLAVEPATGKTIYRHVRPNAAMAESKESYGTPMPYSGNGRKEILIVGGDCVTGHDPETGKEFWRLGGWNPTNNTSFRVVPSLVVYQNRVIVCTPQGQGKVLAVTLGGNGDVTGTHKAWENTQVKSDVPSPALYQGMLYLLDGDFKKGMNCIDPATGQVKWFTPVQSRGVLRSSPLAADGKLYFMNEEGQAWVMSATDGKILSTASLATEGQARGSIIAAAGRVYVRTGSTLYCFGQAK